MKRRDFNIGAILALFCTGSSMTPENERKAVAALERIAASLETMARNSGRSALAEVELPPTDIDVEAVQLKLAEALKGQLGETWARRAVGLPVDASVPA